MIWKKFWSSIYSIRQNVAKWKCSPEMLTHNLSEFASMHGHSWNTTFLNIQREIWIIKCIELWDYGAAYEINKLMNDNIISFSTRKSTRFTLFSYWQHNISCIRFDHTQKKHFYLFFRISLPFFFHFSSLWCKFILFHWKKS